jgi:hypothetical protein
MAIIAGPLTATVPLHLREPRSLGGTNDVTTRLGLLFVGPIVLAVLWALIQEWATEG